MWSGGPWDCPYGCQVSCRVVKEGGCSVKNTHEKLWRSGIRCLTPFNSVDGDNRSQSRQTSSVGGLPRPTPTPRFFFSNYLPRPLSSTQHPGSDSGRSSPSLRSPVNTLGVLHRMPSLSGRPEGPVQGRTGPREPAGGDPRSPGRQPATSSPSE